MRAAGRLIDFVRFTELFWRVYLVIVRTKFDFSEVFFNC